MRRTSGSKWRLTSGLVAYTLRHEGPRLGRREKEEMGGL